MTIYLNVGYAIDAKGWYVNKKFVKQVVNGRLTYFDKTSMLYPQPEREVAP